LGLSAFFRHACCHPDNYKAFALFSMNASLSNESPESLDESYSESEELMSAISRSLRPQIATFFCVEFLTLDPLSVEIMLRSLLLHARPIAFLNTSPKGVIDGFKISTVFFLFFVLDLLRLSEVEDLLMADLLRLDFDRLLFDFEWLCLTFLADLDLDFRDLDLSTFFLLETTFLPLRVLNLG